MTPDASAPASPLADGTWKLRGLQSEALGFVHITTLGSLTTTRTASLLALPLAAGTYSLVHTGDEGFTARPEAGEVDEQFLAWAHEHLEGDEVKFVKTTAVRVTATTVRRG